MQDEQSEGEQPQILKIQKTAGDDADQSAENTDLIRAEAKRSCQTGDDCAGWSEKVNVGQFLDLVRFKRERLLQVRHGRAIVRDGLFLSRKTAGLVFSHCVNM